MRRGGDAGTMLGLTLAQLRESMIASGRVSAADVDGAPPLRERRDRRRRAVGCQRARGSEPVLGSARRRRQLRRRDRVRVRAHEVGPIIYAGVLVFPLERGGEVLRASRALMADAPDELTIYEVLITLPHHPPFPPELQGTKAAMLVVAHLGTEEQARADLGPLRELRAGPAASRRTFPARVHNDRRDTREDHRVLGTRPILDPARVGRLPSRGRDDQELRVVPGEAKTRSGRATRARAATATLSRGGAGSTLQHLDPLLARSDDLRPNRLRQGGGQHLPLVAAHIQAGPPPLSNENATPQGSYRPS